MILSNIIGEVWEDQKKLHGGPLFEQKLAEALTRYKIFTVFSARGIGTVRPYVADPNCQGLIMVNGKLKPLNKEKLAEALAEEKLNLILFGCNFFGFGVVANSVTSCLSFEEEPIF